MTITAGKVAAGDSSRLRPEAARVALGRPRAVLRGAELPSPGHETDRGGDLPALRISIAAPTRDL